MGLTIETKKRGLVGLTEEKISFFGMFGRGEKFQLKSKLSRSESLKLAIGKFSFLPISLIYC